MALRTWRNTKEHIDQSKGVVDHFAERSDKNDLELIYELQSKLDKVAQATSKLTKVSTMIGAVKIYVERLKKMSKHKMPAKDRKKFEKLLDVCDNALDRLGNGLNVVEMGVALKAFKINPAGAIEAAWGGPTVAKSAIDMIRAVAPNLDTDAETKKVENRVFQLVGGGAGIGAGAGAAIGGVVGLLFGGIGAPIGAAVGAALGGAGGSTTGAIILALD